MTKQIVLLGGEPASRVLIRRFAEASGFEVVNNMSADVVLVCVDADTGPDWEALRTILHRDDASTIRICLCSWQETPPELDQDIRIDCYLQKPFLLHDFQAALEASGLVVLPDD